ncbi:hypothetical protein L931_05560, partial [Helicobacter pylori PZ5024]
LRDKKGQSVIVNDLGDLWDKAQNLAKKKMDALDSNLLAFLNQNTNTTHLCPKSLSRSSQVF